MSERIIEIEERSHDGHSRLDYGVDWRPFLASGESLITSAWEVTEKPDNKLVLSSGIIVSGQFTTIWAQPGSAWASLTNGRRYMITNRITTDQFRRDDTSIVLVIEDH